MNFEVLLASFVDPVNQGVDMTSLQMKGDDTLVILCQEKEWVCDMGASAHMMWSNKCTSTRNVHDTKMHSLRHTSEAM